jgi:leader peptidase (prepilin peptidase) / N-methyltransferase
VSVPTAIASSLGVFGTIIGSFLNVVVHRVPIGESLVSTPSRCVSCEIPIKRRHNVPVLGWLWLRGRCAGCRAPISARYPLVELGTGLAFATFTVQFGVSADLPAFLYLAAVAVALALIEFDAHEMPNSILLPSYVGGVLLLMPAGAVTGDWRAAGRGAAGMVILGFLYLTLAVTQPSVISAGAIKLAGLLGLYLGWLSWQALLVGAVGAVLAAALGIRWIRGGRRITAAHQPIAALMVLAAAGAMFLSDPITHWYASLLLRA